MDVDPTKTYAVLIETTGERKLIRPELAMDGGMVQFFDPVTDEEAGCCGINWWNETNAIEATELPPPVRIGGQRRGRPSVLGV